MFQKLSVLLDLFNRKERKQLSLLFLVTTINGLVQALGIVSVMPLIALLTEPSLAETNRYLVAFTQILPVSWQGHLLLVLGGVVFLILLAGNAILTLDYWLTLKFFNSKEYKLSVRLLNDYVNREYLSFKDTKVSEMSRNVISEVDRVLVGTLLALVKLISDSIISLLIVGLLLYANFEVTLIVSVVLGAAYGIVYLLINTQINILGDQFPKFEKVMYSAVKQTLEFYKEIRVYGVKKHFLQKYAEPTKIVTQNGTSYYLLRLLPAQIIEVTAFGIVICVAVYFSTTGNSSAQIAGTLAFFAFAVYRLVPLIKDIFEGAEELKFLGRSLEGLLSQFENTADHKQEDTRTREKMEIKRDICISGLSFKYDQAPNQLFDKLSIRIPAGKFTCIVGPSGVGKSTLLDILLGLIRPDSGEILIDDRPLTPSNFALWQNAIGYVPQNIQLLEASVLENIAFGIPSNDIDRKRVMDVATIAGIDAFIKSGLADGYDTVVGDGRISVSGGQKQRIGIARSLYHKPSVLILDEATNELDKETEVGILDALLRIEGLTIIFVSHKSSVQEKSDVVISLFGIGQQTEEINSA